MPPSFDVGRTISASPEAAWAVVSDTTRWPEWSPLIAAAEADDRYVEAGSEGRLQTPLGVWLNFVVTDVEAGRLWRWQVARLPATGHRVDPVDNDPGACRMVIEVPYWAAPYAWISAVALRRLEQLVLATAG